MTSVLSPATPTSNEMNIEKADSGVNGEQDSDIASCDTNGSSINILPKPDIKEEEPLDIDDMAPADIIKRMPIISLTPTSKLLATRNPTDPKRKFVCPYEECGKSYGKSSHLRSHLTWHTGVKPFVCQEPNCGKGFTRSDELNRHVRTHTGEKPFECVQCTKKFSRSDHLTKHLATHVKQQKASKRKSNNAKSTKVTTPRKEVLSDADKGPKLGNTQTVSPKHPLNITQQEKQSFEENTNTPFIHQPIKIKLERPENSSEYQIVPTSISRSLSAVDDSNSELIIGDDEIMPEANAPPELTPEVSIKPEPEDSDTEHTFSCEQCSKTFSSESDLDRHAHSEERDLQSEILTRLETNGSNSSFFQPQAIEPERPFNCSVCKKAFRRQDDLNRHIRTHTGEKPYACNECDRRFVRSDHLKKHMQTHIRLR